MSESLDVSEIADGLNATVARLQILLRRCAAAEPRDLPNAQMELLWMVEHSPGTSVKQAAEALHTAPNTVSTLVSELVGAGLLDPHPGPREPEVGPPQPQ